MNTTNFQSKPVEHTPSCHTSAVTAGDVLADTEEVTIPHASADSDASGEITYVHLLDKDDKGVALDIVFLKSNVSLGTEGSAISISDSDAENIITTVSLDTYVDYINSQTAEKAVQIPYDASRNKIYVAVVARGGETYTESGLRIRFSCYTNR
jgi:hypothetical protein